MGYEIDRSGALFTAKHDYVRDYLYSKLFDPLVDYSLFRHKKNHVAEKDPG